jgi:hypothetical protein
VTDELKPRFTKVGTVMSSYAELGIRIAEESLVEMKRHNADVEKLLEDIRFRLSMTVVPLPAATTRQT